MIFFFPDCKKNWRRKVREGEETDNFGLVLEEKDQEARKGLVE